MNKRLLICALLSIGQLVFSSSYAKGTDVEPSPDSTRVGHMHHKPSTAEDVGVVSTASPVVVYKREDFSGALSSGTAASISLQLMNDCNLSELLTGVRYSFVKRFMIGFPVTLNEGDLIRIASAFPKLTALGVSGTGLSALSSEELITELPKLIYLQELNITGKNITDEVIEALVPLAGTLQVLHINYATLTARGVEALKRFSNLTYLNTVGTRIEKSEIADIKRIIPALGVEGAFEKSTFFSFPDKK